MNKIPCIKCDSKLWKYVRPYLDGWGYNLQWIVPQQLNSNSYLVTNRCGVFGDCGNFDVLNEETYNRESITNVEEFLEQTAKLKGFAYERKDIIEIHGIEIKPGMGICLDSKNDSNKFYIVFPAKSGLAVVNYGQSCCWLHLDLFLSRYKDRIVAICDLATQNDIVGNILWEAPKEIVLTMDDIAKKFGYPVEQIKIKI